MKPAQSARQLFFVFSKIAMQGFGGVLPIIQREIVERLGWLSEEEFLEDWALAQIMPGPNVVNFALVLGDRYFGWRGAAAAAAGLLCAPLLLMMGLALIYRFYADNPIVLGMLRGMGAAAAGLIGATSLKMMRGLQNSPLGKLATLAIIASTFALVVSIHIPLFYVVLGVGIPSCYFAYYRMKNLEQNSGVAK